MSKATFDIDPELQSKVKGSQIVPSGTMEEKVTKVAYRSTGTTHSSIPEGTTHSSVQQQERSTSIQTRNKQQPRVQQDLQTTHPDQYSNQQLRGTIRKNH